MAAWVVAARDVEVVILRDEGEEEASTSDVRAGSGVVRRRSAVALLAALAVLGLLAGPLPAGRPDPQAERPATAAASPATPVANGRPCPPTSSRRLWCSFIDDPGCCPSPEQQPVLLVLPSGWRAH